MDPHQLIEDSKAKLREAAAQAKDEPNIVAQIEKQIDDLVSLQAELTLAALVTHAEVLNSLSDVLDKAIGTIRHNVDNLLFGDILKLKKTAERGAGKGAGASPTRG